MFDYFLRGMDGVPIIDRVLESGGETSVVFDCQPRRLVALLYELVKKIKTTRQYL